MDTPPRLGPPPAVTIQDVLRVFWRRKGAILLVFAVSLGTSAYVSKHTAKRFRAEAELILVQRAPTLSLSSQNNYTGPMTETTETQLALLQGPHMAEKTVDLLKNEAQAHHRPTSEIGTSVEELRKSLTATVPKDTNLIAISVEADSKEQAQNLANAVSRAFVEWKQDMAQQSFKDAMNSLETRATRAAAELSVAERQVETFKRSHHLVDVPVQQQDLLHQYMQRETEVTDLAKEQSGLLAHVQTAQTHLGETNAAIRQAPGLRDDTQALALQQQLSQLEMERASAALRYMPEYPGVLPEMDAHIKDVKTRLNEAVAGTVENKRPSLQAQGAAQDDLRQAQLALALNQTKLGAATRLRDQLRQQIQGVPEASLQYARLTRNTDLARTLATSLQGSLNSARLDKDMASGNVQVVQEARLPDLPFRPNHTRDLLVGGGVGLVLALITTLLLEQADARVRTFADVQRLVSAPIIGTLPRLSRAKAHALSNGETSPQVAEAYSLAQANLSIAVRRATQAELGDKQVVLITSALAGEGKSVTAAQIARSLARTGKRVVLLDADLRRPVQNRLFNTDEPHGLAEVLRGIMTLPEVLVASDTDNLLLVHSGQPDRPPAELLSQPRMAEVLMELREEADVVIVDTPACALVADALFLAPHAECILYVVGAGSVDRETVRSTQAILAASEPEVFTCFVNRAPRERGHRVHFDAAWSGLSRASRRVAVLPPATPSAARAAVLPEGDQARITPEDEASPNPQG
jgi:succinoglycan biosynthesis transport protein ExoP